MNGGDLITPEYMAQKAMLRQLARQQSEVDRLTDAVCDRMAELARLNEELARATAMRDAVSQWLSDRAMLPRDLMAG